MSGAGGGMSPTIHAATASRPHSSQPRPLEAGNCKVNLQDSVLQYYRGETGCFKALFEVIVPGGSLLDGGSTCVTG